MTITKILYQFLKELSVETAAINPGYFSSHEWLSDAIEQLLNDDCQFLSADVIAMVDGEYSFNIRIPNGCEGLFHYENHDYLPDANITIVTKHELIRDYHGNCKHVITSCTTYQGSPVQF